MVIPVIFVYVVDMMIAISLGIDHIEGSYPFMIGENGKCISSGYEIEYENYDNTNNFNYDVKIMDLNDCVYENDHTILVNGCKCFTCSKNYTRAYIHHLLKCTELNATTLLIM